MTQISASESWAVDVHRLSRSFRGKTALDEIELQIPTGSIYGLVGLNGAGKTTLIRHLIGTLAAKHGTVRVLGQDPVASPEGLLKRVGYLSEEDSLPPWMRVGELIDFSRAIYPTWDDAYAVKCCDLFSLSRTTKLKSLSKGGRARAGLLVAIAHRPELLILDEPSSGLDPIARRDILEAIIRTVNDEGRTVLFSSHLLEEVDRVCDQVALLHQGRIAQTIRCEQLISDFVELIFCPEQDTDVPPPIESAWGWQKTGREWSGIVSRSWLDSETDPRAEREGPMGLMESRPVSLARWFSGHVSPSTGDLASETQRSAPEVSSNV